MDGWMDDYYTDCALTELYRLCSLVF